MRNTVFVTGGSGGIGSEICREFGKLGYPVAIGYNTNKKSAELIAEEITASNGIAMAVKCDVSNIQSINNAINIIKDNLGDVEILVNNAGTANINLFTSLTTEEIYDLINTNLIGAMLCSKAVLPHMINRKHGKIINITSVWGEVGASCETVYSAAKAGLIGFTKALGKEVAPSGINVNAISAGLIDTPMNDNLSTDDISEIINEIPANRIGQPKDIAKAVMFLASESADYICGQIIRVDGGWQG
ncbi:MAG: elongation factor P 5-aminopentanone reductase [Oscillospiraceae bacterium]